jgi:hypothetical protein
LPPYRELWFTALQYIAWWLLAKYDWDPNCKLQAGIRQ